MIDLCSTAIYEAEMKPLPQQKDRFLPTTALLGESGRKTFEQGDEGLFH